MTTRNLTTPKRVIPCLDVTGGRVVKGINFVDLKDAGDPIEIAAAYDKAGADEIVFLDITATTDKRPAMHEVAARTGAAISVPFIVGGGMHTLGDVQTILDAGADKISLNTAVVNDPDLIGQIASTYGSERLIVAIDAKKAPGTITRWDVMTNGGRTNTGLDVIEWAREATRRGAGEILLTSMDCDGVQDGYDIELTRAVARAVDVPVVASGGAGKIEDFVEAIIEGEADAVLAASVFHFGTLTIAEVKEAMAAAGIAVRI
ncbi:MAG: imidazole glycerol phosphate synthase subunit HisF [Coriobacteriia bacterium]|nr:imidazole glycerol phosphate synthase subunit HisF [Coriobacteriia bacterium]